MIKEFLDEFSTCLPSQIEYLNEESCSLILKTTSFGFSALTSWRILNNCLYKIGSEEIEDDCCFFDFRYKLINKLHVQSKSCPIDPSFEVNNNTIIEIFSDNDLEPWAGSVQNKTGFYANGIVDDNDKVLISPLSKFEYFRVYELPRELTIDKVSFKENSLNLSGHNWRFSTKSGWRVDNENELIFGKGTVDVAKGSLVPIGSTFLESMLPTLVKATIIDIRTQSIFFPYDPVFVLDDGRKIEIFSDRAENSWEFEMADVGKWVASPKNEKVISFTPA